MARHREVAMRRVLLLGAFVLPILLPILSPTPVLAGTCPALDEGVVDKDVYRLGELIDFYGNYHDFADPGTVTVVFERSSDGARRDFTAGNLPDGAWTLRFTFESPDDIGTWDVTVVVDQTGALDTCTDQVTIRGRSGVPNTATAMAEPESTGATPAAPPVLPAVAGLVVGLLAMRRFGGQGSRSNART
jgi:hypothetical protein